MLKTACSIITVLLITFLSTNENQPLASTEDLIDQTANANHEFWTDWDQLRAKICSQTTSRETLTEVFNGHRISTQMMREMVEQTLNDLIELQIESHLISLDQAEPARHQQTAAALAEQIPLTSQRLRNTLDDLEKHEQELSITIEQLQSADPRDQLTLTTLQSWCEQSFAESKKELQAATDLIMNEITRLEPLINNYHDACPSPQS